MDLTCAESTNKCIRAVKDRVIFKDERVINNLLNEEIFYVPNCDYFTTVQNDIQPFMRKVVTTWMLEVCEEQRCEEQILPLAVNLMDRFLCTCKIKRQHLQLLGATCLLIASKLRSTNFLPIDLLCAYTDYSVTYDLVANWEQLVLSKLQYKLSAITGYDYIDHVIERCSWSQNHELLRRHAHTLVSICSTEPSLIQTLPSLIAAACLSSAVRGLKLSCQSIAVDEICSMLNVDVTKIDLYINVVDSVVERVANPEGAEKKTKEPAKKPAGYESPTYGQPETPTEVENVYF
ncbi:G1/S-specific cyclin-D2 [Anthonomus grandis grandis]|uniref:G1/S-specific cyclin-D2 n=1 Tax=Anthonomus grandis grandis TaxID=2921223 RepID=UPI002166091B|nr:G1/S-specific cyclin-D2 [Anthonomus grandis grandis]